MIRRIVGVMVKPEFGKPLVRHSNANVVCGFVSVVTNVERRPPLKSDHRWIVIHRLLVVVPEYQTRATVSQGSFGHLSLAMFGCPDAVAGYKHADCSKGRPQRLLASCRSIE